MRCSIWRPILVVAVFCALATQTTHAGSRVVNCDRGDSLEQAVNSGKGSAAELEITLIGTCYESVDMSRDRVSITGDGNTTIHGQLRIFDSDPVVLSNLTITGPGHGIVALNARVRLLDSHIVGNGAPGIRARLGAVVSVRDGSIANNGGEFGAIAEAATLHLIRTDVVGNGGVGIAILDNSRLYMLEGSVTDQAWGSGVTVSQNSSARFERTTIARNGDVGVYLSANSAMQIDDGVVTDNATQGVEALGSCVLNVAGGEVSRNGANGVIASLQSVVELIDTRIESNLENGVLVHSDSGVVVRGPTFIQMNAGWDLICDGDESSAEVWLEPPGTIGTMSCTGF